MRRYDLDWIRILVFGLLIFYHIGMFFVPWDWHLKNNQSYEWLQIPMLFVNQWRLPILFLISGMGTHFALSKRSLREFILERNKRLLIPLVFGMLVVVAPQVYIERLVEGDFQGSFIQFYPHYFEGIYPSGNFSWHHLWFLPYLLVYSLLLSPAFIYLREHPNSKIIQFSRSLLKSRLGIFAFLLPLLLSLFLLEPYFPVKHNLVDDWFNFTFSLILFFYGYLFISLGNLFWEKARALRQKALLLGILSFGSYLALRFISPPVFLLQSLIFILKALNLGAWIIAILSYSQQYLQVSGRHRAYWNQAVYPFYILHQTLIIILAYFVYDASMHDFWKFLLLMGGTFLGAWLLFELLRRTRLTRLLFGIKALPSPTKT